MFFVDANIYGGVKLNENRNLKNEIIAGIIIGMIVGAIIAMAVFSSLNIWFLVFSSANDLLVLLTTAVIWIIFIMSSTLYYKLLRETILKEISFFVGLSAIIGLTNYVYNTYNMSPYDSLETSRIIALVMMGTGLGLAMKMIAKIKEEAKETSQ